MILIVLVLAAFLQASSLSFNLLLLALIARSFITRDRKNLYLAMAFGLLLSLLLDRPLGSLSLIYLLMVTVVHLVKKTPLASRWIIILPLAAILLTVDRLLEGLIFDFGWDTRATVIEVILILPVYFVVRFWEERFVPRKEIRLKLGK